MSQPVCAIVGVGTGVSMGVARAFGKDGYALALLARNPDRLAASVNELAQAGYHAQTFAADAGDDASLIQAFTQIRDQMGDPSVLVYNAAAFTMGKPSTIAVDPLITDFRVNVAGALVA